MTITLDSSKAGVDDVSARVDELRGRIEGERARGLHGYIDVPGDAEALENLLRIAQARMGRFAHLVVLGIGGSALGLRMLSHALRYLDASMPELHVVDNTDPALISRVQARIDLKRTLFVVVSKSGGTLETVLALGHFAGLLQRQNLRLADHILAATDPEDGYLRAFANEHELQTADVPSAVGGRFSVLTAAGLLPAALLGLDVPALLAGAERAYAADWPGRLGVLSAEQCKLGKTGLVFMPYSSRLEFLSDWFVQLWDESLGKDGKGQTAIRAVGATDQHAQLQLFMEGPNDKLMLFIKLARHEPDVKIGPFDWQAFGCEYVNGRSFGEVINAQCAGTVEACVRQGRNVLTLDLSHLGASTLGELVQGLMLATTYAGMVLDVNTYNQPAVELGKQISRKMLGG